ncbi:MAG: type II secretion system protein [Phycisphaerales bacterium]|nr:type II secretion system protein [Phycisphaerales bacterium]
MLANLLSRARLIGRVGGDDYHRCRRGHGFTLVEVMIAIALVLVLILGATQVFRLTSQTVSSAQALQVVMRDARAAETTMVADSHSMVSSTDQPALMIWSQRTYAFLNENEEEADLDKHPETVDHDNGVEGDSPGEWIAPAFYGNRNHRTDILSFFANGQFRRQTSNNNDELISPGVSIEAWINYGHLLVPRPAEAAIPPSPNGTWIPLPSDSSDPAYGQRYAGNWILGRNVILLDNAAAGAIARSPGDNLSPLRPVSTGPGGVQLWTSRYDVANTSVRDYFTAILNAPNDWYRGALLFRFQADPQPNPAGGYDAGEVARTTPIFLRNCTGFAVEYAGDFLGQYEQKDYPSDPSKWGAVYSVYTMTDKGTDGQIDYYYDPPNAADAVKKIRWYGLPRDTNGDGAINYVDVIPLRDLWELVYKNLTPADDPDGRVGPQAPFEKFPGDVYPDATMPVNVSTGEHLPNLGYLDPSAGLRPSDAYLCVWGPTDRKPSMIRVTLFLNDPNNRLSEGQIFQYVMKVP